MTSKIIAFAEQRLESLLARPEMWGPPLCVELQFLLLIQVWHAAACSDDSSKRLVHIEYQRFCRGPLPISSSTFDITSFAERLRTFWAQFTQSHPKQDILDCDVAIALNMLKGHAPSELVLSSSLRDFRRALRGVMRPPRRRSTGGRAEKMAETLTNFDLVSIDILQPNGKGGRIEAALRQPRPPQQDWIHKGQAEQALKQLGEMAVSATSEREPSSFKPGRETAWLARQTMNLLPHSGVESVEFGGRMVQQRSPIVLRSTHRVALARHFLVERQPFKESGEIRKVDRDNATFAFLTDQGQRVECWIDNLETLQDIETDLRQHRTVKGQLMTGGHLTKDVVLVSQIARTRRSSPSN